MVAALLKNTWIFSHLILSSSSAVQAFVSSNSRFCTRQQSILSRLFAQGEEEEEEGGPGPIRPSPIPNRSIGNVVQGLHGSKYQFGSAGINYEGQQFAEMGYSSGLKIEQDNYDDEPMPLWALKLEQTIPPSDDNNCPQLELELALLDSHAGMAATVQVQNQERSWEKYYAFIVGSDPADAACFSSIITVEPRVGMLAPRGGVNDFSDRAQVTITVHSQPLPGNINNNCWLLIGTEEENWFYKLMIV
jgi:hypothetical protein